jgi:phosphonoacetate hydrolase
MNAKTTRDGSPNVRYLSDELRASGVKSAHVVLPITDRYVRHHAALGSACWVHVDPDEIDRATTTLQAIEGVEEVIAGDLAAVQLRLPRDRIGDLVVFADRRTVLGKSRAEHDISMLRGALRSHGGRHEQRIPLLLSEAPTPAVAATLAAGVTNADTHRLLIGASP